MCLGCLLTPWPGERVYMWAWKSYSSTSPVFRKGRASLCRLRSLVKFLSSPLRTDPAPFGGGAAHGVSPVCRVCCHAAVWKQRAEVVPAGSPIAMWAGAALGGFGGRTVCRTFCTACVTPRTIILSPPLFHWLYVFLLHITQKNQQLNLV